MKIINKLRKNLIVQTLLYSYTLALSISFVWIFMPGFMSYDTLHALREARGAVETAVWPPMVSYIWRGVDLVSQHPSAMHFVQVALVLASATSITAYFSEKKWTPWVISPLILMVPVLTGTLAVIWKDVLTAGLLLSSLAIVLQIPAKRSKTGGSAQAIVATLSVLSILVLFLGITTRHNSITAAIPIGFLLAYRVLTFAGVKRFFSGLTVLLSLGLLSSLMFAKDFLDTYSLPELKVISGPSHLTDRVMAFDLAGASICSGTAYLEPLAPGLTLEVIKSQYDPRHIVVNRYLGDVASSDVSGIWLQAFTEDPVCLMSRRWETFAWLLGLNLGGPYTNVHPFLIGTEPGGQYLITHPFVDENEFGYSLEPSSTREAVVNYVLSASSHWFFRPWFVGAFGVLSAAFLVFASRPRLPYLTLALSAIAYAAGIFLAGNASDARLLFFSTLVWLIFCVLGIEKGIITVSSKGFGRLSRRPTRTEHFGTYV